MSVCALIALALGAYKYTEIQAAIALGESFPETVAAVEPFTVLEVTRQPELTVTGEVIALQTLALRNELAGRITAVTVTSGGAVKADQVLLQQDVSEEQAQLAEARAQQKISELALQRAQKLVRNGAGSVENRDQAQASFDAASARIRALQALIEKKTIRAPFDATASLHRLEPGQYLDAGSTIVDLVGNAERVWVDFTLPQEYADIGVGSEVRIITNQQTAGLQALVQARDASISSRSRNLRLRAELPQPSPQLLAGTLVQVAVPLAKQQTVVEVPVSAVRHDALGTSVYVLQDSDEQGERVTRATKRPVTAITLRDRGGSADRIVITDGLRAGEVIAANGAFKLRDGAKVAPLPAQQVLGERRVGL